MSATLTNPAAEWSVVSQMLSRPSVIPEVMGTQLEARDFSAEDAALVFATGAELYYADRRVEPLTVAEVIKQQLAPRWEVSEEQLPQKLVDRVAAGAYADNVLDHAAIIKRLSTGRQLVTVARGAVGALEDGKITPEEVASQMSTDALAITSGSVKRTELLSWMEMGTEYMKYLARMRKARESGIEMGVYTNLPFLDDFTKGIAPTELFILGGDPGVGKSSVAWKAAEGFAHRQLAKDPEIRVGTLVLSLEMGLIPSTGRVVQSITGIDGMQLREGNITDYEYRLALREWKNRGSLPIWHNFASNFRLSQMRALIIEAIRRHNVGFVVIDHFRMIDTDSPFSNPNQEDEAKVRFLKENIAKDLNVAVMCLAHSIKVGRNTEGNRRPRLSDLRGSGQIAAHADFVGFMYRPGRDAGEEEQLDFDIKESDAELVWAKNRHGNDGVGYFTFEPATMTIKPKR